MSIPLIIVVAVEISSCCAGLSICFWQEEKIKIEMVVSSIHFLDKVLVNDFMMIIFLREKILFNSYRFFVDFILFTGRCSLYLYLRVLPENLALHSQLHLQTRHVDVC